MGCLELVGGDVSAFDSSWSTRLTVIQYGINIPQREDMAGSKDRVMVVVKLYSSLAFGVYGKERNERAVESRVKI